MEKLIKRGAEAEIYLSEWRGRKVIVKKRIKKGYRIKELDEEIREKRTKKEALLMASARQAGISVPIIYDVNLDEKKIVMEYVNGERLKDVLDVKSEEEQKEICYKIGENIANLHLQGIIHGDITTSNMILKDGRIYFIDFGLGMKSEEIEDKGVDLHLLMEAFKAAHRNEKLFSWVIEAYGNFSDESKEVEKKIKEIERRGRYMRRVS